MTQSNKPHILPAGMRKLWPVFRLIQRLGSPEKVAGTSIYLASAPEVANITGQYFESSTRPKDLSPEVIEQAKQEKTWELAAALIGNAPTSILGEAEPVIQSIAGEIR